MYYMYVRMGCEYSTYATVHTVWYVGEFICYLLYGGYNNYVRTYATYYYITYVSTCTYYASAIMVKPTFITITGMNSICTIIISIIT